MMQIQVLMLLLTLATLRVDACGGFDQLRYMLNTNEGGLADSLRDCVAPLLFGSTKWLPSDQAHEFCNQEACKCAVNKLKKIPSCTWESEIPSGSDANTLAIAQQVMRDCGSASS